MANKKISDLTAYTSPVSGNVVPINDGTPTTKKITVDNLFKILSSLFRIKDSSDTTKQVAFDTSGITTGTTRTLTVPDVDLTLIGKDNTVTVTNKTLGSGTAITLGSDAEGDTYYRNAAGVLVRLARGTDNYIMKMNGNVPNWEAETVNANGSTTVAGIFEAATSSEVTAGTATGGTGAALVVTPDALAASTPVFDGSGLTNVVKMTRLAGYTPASNTTENTVYSTTINANSLSSNGYILVRTPAILVSNATAETFTIKLKFGGTTLFTTTLITNAVGGGNNVTAQGVLEGWIINNAATNSQNVSLHFAGGANINASSNLTPFVWTAPGDTTSAIDTTSNQTLTMTVTRTNGSGGSCVFLQTMVETVKQS